MNLVNPPYYSDYKKYKPFLREEFSYSCVYCEIRESEIGGKKSFHIDHYKPKNRFPELECQYDNLLYSCRDCNSCKGSYWPSRAQRVCGQVVLNPRLHAIDKHVDKSKPEWRGTTWQGKWNVKKFRLASRLLVLKRKDRIFLEQQIVELQGQMETCTSRKLTDLVDALKRKIAIGPFD